MMSNAKKPYKASERAREYTRKKCGAHEAVQKVLAHYFVFTFTFGQKLHDEHPIELFSMRHTDMPRKKICAGAKVPWHKT